MIMRRLAGWVSSVLATAVLGWAGSAQAACNVALSPSVIDRVIAVSLGAEFGNAKPLITKWRNAVRIGVLGNPSATDQQALDGIIADLGALIAPVKITL